MKQLFYGTITYEMFDLLLDPHLDFLRFFKHKTGWGGKIPSRGIFTPTLYYWHAMGYVT